MPCVESLGYLAVLVTVVDSGAKKRDNHILAYCYHACCLRVVHSIILLAILVIDLNWNRTLLFMF